MKKRILKNIFGLKHSAKIKPFKKTNRLSGNKIIDYDINVKFDPHNAKRYAKKLGKKAWKRGGRELGIATAGGVLGTAIYSKGFSKKKRKKNYGK